MRINEAQAFLSSRSCFGRFWRKCCQCCGGVWHWLSTHGGPQRNTLTRRLNALIPPHVLLSIQESFLQEEHVWSPDEHKRLNSAHGLGVTRLSQCHDNVDSLNPLWPIDIIWRHGSRSTLAQVMACCLTAPSHYLNQFDLSSVRANGIHLRAIS